MTRSYFRFVGPVFGLLAFAVAGLADNTSFPEEEKTAPQSPEKSSYRKNESKEMLYLRNIVKKLHFMQTTIDRLETRLDELEVSMIQLGAGNSEAFQMCRTAVQALAENQESVQSDLSDAMGNVRSATWNTVNV